MIFQGTNPQLMATEQILVSSFVKMDSAVKYGCKQCTGPQDLPIGVSQQGSWQTPGVPGTNTNYCTPPSTSTSPPAPSATSPYQISVYGVGSVVRLQLSSLSAAISPGDLICSAQDGTGIDVNNASIGNLEHSYAGAIALTSGNGGEFIRVLVITPFPIGPGASGGVLRVSLTPATVGAWTAADQTFSIAGFNGTANDPVVVSGEALPAGLGIVNAIALSPGSLKIRFANVTASSIAPSAQFFDIVVVG